MKKFQETFTISLQARHSLCPPSYPGSNSGHNRSFVRPTDRLPLQDMMLTMGLHRMEGTMFDNGQVYLLLHYVIASESRPIADPPPSETSIIGDKCYSGRPEAIQCNIISVQTESKDKSVSEQFLQPTTTRQMQLLSIVVVRSWPQVGRCDGIK